MDDLIKIHVTQTIGRQGDVLIVPSKQPFSDIDLGEQILEQDSNRVVLAHGEVTGHAHAFYPDRDVLEGLIAAPANDAQAVAAVRLFELNKPSAYTDSTSPGIRALRLTTRAFLRHEEHTVHSLPPGDYCVIQQHEGDELDELRRVAD